MLQRRHQPLLSLTWVLGRPHAQEEENPLPLRRFLVNVGLNEPKQHGCILRSRVFLAHFSWLAWERSTRVYLPLPSQPSRGR